MEILLIKDYSEIGFAGENVKVKDGYARNFLFPKDIAVKATASNLKKYSGFIEKMKKIREKEVKSAEEFKEKLDKLVLNFKEKASAEGRLYGSVGVQQISDKIKEEGYEIDKKNIIIPVHIKEAGTYSAKIRLYHGIDAVITINVEAEQEDAPPEEVAFHEEPEQDIEVNAAETIEESADESNIEETKEETNDESNIEETNDEDSNEPDEETETEKLS